MQHINSVDNQEALKLKLKKVVVRDLINGKRVVEIYKMKMVNLRIRAYIFYMD